MDGIRTNTIHSPVVVNNKKYYIILSVKQIISNTNKQYWVYIDTLDLVYHLPEKDINSIVILIP